MKIQIKFRRHGIIKLIDHLDVTRHSQKAIYRADVDVRYSGGLSPHQIISFAAPLGVGITSNGEYVDIEVTFTRDSETVKRCLSEVMSEGFEIVSYRILPDDVANAMSITGAGGYTLAFRPGYEPEGMDKEQWFQGFIVFFERPSVMVIKQTKRGKKKMDLKPLVYGLNICPEGDSGMEGLRLFMKISTGSAVNVRPEQVLNAYYGSLRKERPPLTFMVQREEVCTDRAPEAEKEVGIYPFISLGQLGEEVR